MKINECNFHGGGGLCSRCKENFLCGYMCHIELKEDFEIAVELCEDCFKELKKEQEMKS